MKQRRKASRRARRAAKRGSNAERGPNLAIHSLRVNVEAAEAEMKAMHDHMPGCTRGNPLQDQASQPGSTPARKIDAVRAAPIMTIDPSPSDVGFERIAGTLHNMIICGHPLPIFLS